MIHILFQVFFSRFVVVVLVFVVLVFVVDNEIMSKMSFKLWQKANEQTNEWESGYAKKLFFFCIFFYYWLLCNKVFHFSAISFSRRIHIERYFSRTIY